MFNELCKVVADSGYKGRKQSILELDSCIDMISDSALEGFFGKSRDPIYDKVVEILKQFESYIIARAEKMEKNFLDVLKIGETAHETISNKKPDLKIFKTLTPEKTAMKYSTFIEGIEEQKLLAPALRSFFEVPTVTNSGDMKKFYDLVDTKARGFKRFYVIEEISHPAFDGLLRKSDFDKIPYEKLGYSVNFPELFFKIGKTTSDDVQAVLSMKSELITRIKQMIVMLEASSPKVDPDGARLVHRQAYSMYQLWSTAAACVWWEYYDHGTTIARKIASCYK